MKTVAIVCVFLAAFWPIVESAIARWKGQSERESLYDDGAQMRFMAIVVLALIIMIVAILN